MEVEELYTSSGAKGFFSVPFPDTVEVGYSSGKAGGGGGDSAGPGTPTTPAPPPPRPPPPLGAFGQQLVAKGVALRRPWAPKAPDAT